MVGLKKITFFGLLLTIGWGGIFHSPAVHAQAPAVSFTGIDIIFLVDQSGSMGGPAFGMPGRDPTDPQGWRFQSMADTMESLGDFAHYAEPNATVRMSVIGFGDPQRTSVLDWTELAPDGYTDAQWEQQKIDLGMLLNQDHFGYRNFGYTNFEGALQLAQSEFDLLPPPPNGGQSLRVIMIITDGEPCAVADADASGNCAPYVDRNRAQLERAYQLTSTAFPEPYYRIHFLGIEAPPISYWSTYQDLWERIVGDPSTRTHIIADGFQMAQAVSDITDDLRGEISNAMASYPCNLDANGDCEWSIPPYVRQVRFVVYKPCLQQPVENVTIYSPNNATPIQRLDSGVTVSSDTANIEIWAIIFPDYGAWRVHVADPGVPECAGQGANVEVEVEQSYMQSQLIQPTPAPYEWQVTPALASLFHENPSGGGNVPVAQALPDYPLTMQAVITAPDGTQQTINLPDYFDPTCLVDCPQFRGEFVPIAEGAYRVEFMGTVFNWIDQQTGQAFMPLDTRGVAARWTEMEVLPTAVTVQLDPVLAQRGGSWLETDPLQVCVIVKDPVTGMLISNLRLSVDASLTQADGSQPGAILPPDATGLCSFVGTITPTVVGQSQLAVSGWLTDALGNRTQEVFHYDQYDGPEYSINVIPVTFVRLSIEIPATAESTSDAVQSPAFWQKEAMVVQVVARNVADGSRADNFDLWVGGNIAPDPDPIRLQVLKGGDLEDVTGSHTLTRLSGSDYELRTADFGKGSYQVIVTGDPLPIRECACAYAPATTGVPAGNYAQVIIDRQYPWASLLLWWGGGLVGLILLALLAWRAWRWSRAISINPLSGLLRFYVEYFDELRPEPQVEDVGLLNLAERKCNQIKLNAKAINPNLDWPFLRLEITASGQSGWSGQIPVKVAVTMRDRTTKTLFLQPGGAPQEIFWDQSRDIHFFIEKDPGAAPEWDDPGGESTAWEWPT